jgi:quinol monooxygenase YgiN
MTVAAIYRFRAADGKAEELLAMLRQGRDVAATVEGCEKFEVYQGSDDPHKFALVERWTSKEAHNDHFEKNVKGSGVLDAAELLMTEPFEPPYESYYRLRSG